MLQGELVAQPGPTAIPGLMITTSVEANGMGGAAATAPSTEALSLTVNPGQLGYFSLANTFSASIYAPKSELLPGMVYYAPGVFHETMSASAVCAGFNLQNTLSLPFSASVGIGYSKTDIDFGLMLLTSSTSPQVLASFSQVDRYDAFSIGLGAEYLVRVGVGVSFKSIDSRIPLIGSSPPSELIANPSAHDFGVLLDIPVDSLVSRFSGNRLTIGQTFRPMLDISAAYVRSNVGGDVRYGAGGQADPLPRTALSGFGIRTGLITRAGNSDCRLITLGLVRQAEDVLVIRHDDGTYDYKSGLGDLSIGQNLIVGRATDYVLVRKGWEIGVGDVVFVRGGSALGDGFDYQTSGYTVSLGGLVRLLEVADRSLTGNSWIAYLGEHFDVQYHSATYTATSESVSSMMNGTSFKELCLVIHGLPWQ